MNESSLLSSPLLASPRREGSPASYNSTENDTSTSLQYNEPSSTPLDYDAADDTQMSIADDFASKSTAKQTFIHLLKGYIGPGCLSLPWAVSQVGFVGGTIAIAIMSIWSSYNCWTIVKIKRYIERSNLQTNRSSIIDGIETKSEGASSLASSALTYPDVGEWAYGNQFERFTSMCICTQQLAICTVFFSFIGENIYAVCQLVPEVPNILQSHIGVMTVALPFIMGLSFIPSINALTPVMVAGTILLFSGFGVLGYVIAELWNERPTDPIDIQWREAPLALCAILYSYEGICLILPIESEMAEPKKFKKVFFSAMACVAIILTTVSNICVYAFGVVTNGSITAFLLGKYSDNKSIIVFLMVANTVVSLSVLFTYPLQLFPTFEIIGPRFNKFIWKLRHGRRYSEMNNDLDETDLTGFDPMPTLHEHDVASVKEHVYESNFTKVTSDIALNNTDRSGSEANNNELLRSSMVSNITEPDTIVSIPGDSKLLRMSLVLLTYIIASIIPNVQVLISLAGAIAGSSTALLIPPMLELALIDHLDSKNDITTSPRMIPPSQQQTSTEVTSILYRFDLKGKFWKKKLKCFLLFWIGFVFMIIGAYASISDIIEIWTGKNN